MKSFKELKEDKMFRVVLFIVISLWCFYFIMNMFFVLGEITVCSNMDGSLVKDNGSAVCVGAVSIPLCIDGLGMSHRINDDFSFNYSNIID